jgi:hypothetical protein
MLAVSKTLIRFPNTNLHILEAMQPSGYILHFPPLLEIHPHRDNVPETAPHMLRPFHIAWLLICRPVNSR